MQAQMKSAKWWYWLAATLTLSAKLAAWPGARTAILVVCLLQLAHFLIRDRSLMTLVVQVRSTYLALYLLALLDASQILHALQLVGTLVVLTTDYCILARTLSLAPWNRRRPLSWALVRWTYLSPPRPGSILARDPSA